ncbi:MAG: hydroxyacylglutathione hydrolase [Gammaproteobacteria bacterium]
MAFHSLHRVIPIPAFKDNYIWLIINTENHTAIAVDPGDATPVLQYLDEHQLTLEALLITHHHWDHSNGISQLIKKWPIPVYGPHKENIAGVTHPLKEGDSLHFPSLHTHFDILDIPGHTAGHIAYYGPLGLFCGDTLFAAGCGRLFEGTAEQMATSLDKLAALPDTTAIYCGHEYTENNLHFAQLVEPNNQAIQMRLKAIQQLRQQQQPTLPSTIALEKSTNPFIRKEKKSVKAAAEAFSGQKLFSSAAVFGIIRAWKDIY